MNTAESRKLPFALEREVVIRAPRETVFRFFTDSARFATWWGQGSRIDPRPGGEVYIRYPNAVVAAGVVVEIDAPNRIVLSYGYEGNKHDIPPGSTQVTITLTPHAEGTLLRLVHELATETGRNEHVQGWRYQLAVFANVAARDAHAGIDQIVDRFLALWGEADAAKRSSELAAISTDAVGFRDGFSCTAGRDDLVQHIGAAQFHMPGVTLVREGAVRYCQGTAVVDWIARGPGGNPKGRGINVFELAPDGKIARATGIWAQA